MFTATRIKLSIWYLCIIMLVSIMFSVTIFRILTNELDHEASRISDRYSRQYGIFVSPGQSLVEPEIIQASENRILFSLIYVNVIIFVVAGISGYILAGVTLKPIQEMIDEQNRFIADASHELRTPITSLRSEIEVYLRNKKHTPKETQELIESNLEEANNLQVLSDGLIELAKYKKPSDSMQAKQDIKSILDTSVKQVLKMAKKKNISIQVHATRNTIIGDVNQLTTLFTILLDNAVKYSPKDTTVTITTEKSNSDVFIAITDEGVGIDTKDMPHIFDRFYRADLSRTKQTIPGYGLGLSIAKSIVTQYHGSISVQSTQNSGTTFTVRLPNSA